MWLSTFPGRSQAGATIFELRRSGAPCRLEPQVLDLLLLLVENADRLVTKTEILEKVWNARFVSDSALSARISAARRAIGDGGA